MRIDELLAKGHRPVFSFEFFPPKTEEGLRNLFDAVGELRSLRPDYVSVTYGAGGSTANKTIEIVSRIKEEYGIEAMPHFTCVGSTVDELRETLGAMTSAGVDNVLALRGDPPPGEAYRSHPDGYAFAVDLVAGLKRVAPFEISVAAYPEVHPQASSRMHDLDNLKRKLDAGANRAITNFFFDTAVFLRFLDLCLAAGISAPIVPGIMPVTNLAGLRRMSALSGGTVPDWLGHMFEGLDDDPDTRRMVAAVVAAEQVRLLQANGIDEFHFYTLNRPELTYAIAHILGVRPSNPVTTTA